MTIKNLIFLFVALSFCNLSYAQIDVNDKEMTESSEVFDQGQYVDDIVSRELVEQGMVLEYEPIREADIPWEKRIWRVIDTREKMNLPFRYPNEPFFNILREIAETGDITIFRDEEFTEPLTIEEVNASLNKIDTVVTFDYDTYEEKIQIVENILNWEDINQFRVKEMWFFDKEASRMDVRILGIAPIKDEIDPDTGELKYSGPLFWLYYPELREPLSKKRVYNENNDIAPLSWYDLFEQRFFSSYITKRSNALDLRIKDMFDGYERAGIDRLLESEKIKAELFNFEHDLWTY